MLWETTKSMAPAIVRLQYYPCARVTAHTDSRDSDVYIYPVDDPAFAKTVDMNISNIQSMCVINVRTLNREYVPVGTCNFVPPDKLDDGEELRTSKYIKCVPAAVVRLHDFVLGSNPACDVHDAISGAGQLTLVIDMETYNELVKLFPVYDLTRHENTVTRAVAELISGDSKSEAKKFHLSSITWCITDDNDHEYDVNSAAYEHERLSLNLPLETDITLPKAVDDKYVLIDILTDMLSDKYGFLVLGFDWEPIE